MTDTAHSSSAGAMRVSLVRDGLDPRALLAFLGSALVLAFLVGNPLQIAALTIATWLAVVGLLEPSEYRAYLGYGAITALLVAVLNPLVSRAGTTIVWTGPELPLIGPFTVSAEAIAFGIAMGLRLLAVTGVFALYSALLDADALYRLIAPFSLGSALVVALSIRLFPASLRDANRISDAMRSRGVPMDAGSIVARTKARVPMVESLVMTSLDRAMNLAESLESRGHGRSGRTSLPSPALAPRDRVVLATAVALLAVGVWCAAAGPGFEYYPTLADPVSGTGPAGALAVGLLGSSLLALEWGWSAWLSSRSTT